MRKKWIYISVVFLMAFLRSGAALSAVDEQSARAFVGQDLYLTGHQVISYQLKTGEHTLVFQDGFAMLVGANEFSSNGAVVVLESVAMEVNGKVRIDYRARVYMEGNISVRKAPASRTTDLSEVVIAGGESMVVRFGVSGEVFVTAEKRENAEPFELPLYKRAEPLVGAVGPRFVVQAGAAVPEWIPGQVEVAEVPEKKGLLEKMFVPKEKFVNVDKAVPAVRSKELSFKYPVNLAPAGEVAPEIEYAKDANDGDIATVIGRFYMWQKQDESGGLLELSADNAVIFSSAQGSQDQEKPAGFEGVLGNAVESVYLAGDVVMTEGQRTIRADELYYDFVNKKAIVVNAEMRNFDVKRGIPIYVRAATMRQVAENKFSAEDVTITSSEFYLPQISLTASSIFITDTTTVDEQTDTLTDNSFDAQMRDVRLKLGKRTILYRSVMRSNLQRPDIPLKSVHLGQGSTWGTSVETQWYFSRLLGLLEPEGVESTLNLDYFSKRGPGAGVEIDYMRDEYYGKVLGYIINDSGDDRLGRIDMREDIEPPRKLRGRFFWQHRQYLPYKWQLSTGISYLSDENFLESYYRSEFNVGEQETFIHLKRIEDNRAISFLAKGRLNDFYDELEELPSGEFHLTGESLFDNRFTLYSDTQVSRLRQRIGNEHMIAMDEDSFSFVSHRTELDMPFRAGTFKLVPYLAGTFGYDDRSGFTRTLVDGSGTGNFGEEEIWIGEAGVRIFPQPLWKVYPNVKSRFWDLNQLRHVVEPHFTTVFYEESDAVAEQRDIWNVGISQRLQTKRGIGDEERTVDWMRFDIDFTWVDDGESAGTSGADRFIWSKPIVPLRVLSSPDIFNGDLTAGLRRFEMFGPRRDYFSTDFIWRMSDTTAFLSDMYFDMQSGVVNQLNVGFSRLFWPNLSYYIGSRYLRRVNILDEQGSNALTFAATYVLDPRYTLVFSQQFDFDYGANIRSDVTLIRRYHRMFCGFTFSVDESLDRRAIILSIWPQGVPEMALGSRRYMGLGESASY